MSLTHYVFLEERVFVVVLSLILPHLEEIPPLLLGSWWPWAYLLLRPHLLSLPFYLCQPGSAQRCTLFYLWFSSLLPPHWLPHSHQAWFFWDSSWGWGWEPTRGPQNAFLFCCGYHHDQKASVPGKFLFTNAEIQSIRDCFFLVFKLTHHTLSSQSDSTSSTKKRKLDSAHYPWSQVSAALPSATASPVGRCSVWHYKDIFADLYRRAQAMGHLCSHSLLWDSLTALTPGSPLSSS